MAEIRGRWLATLALAGLLCAASGQSPPSPSPTSPTPGSPPSPSPTPPSPVPGSSASQPPSGTAQVSPNSVPPSTNLNPCYCSPATSDGSYACFNFNAATSDVNCNPRGSCFTAKAAPGEYSIQAGGPVFKCGAPKTLDPRDNPCPESQQTDIIRNPETNIVVSFRCPGFNGRYCSSIAKGTQRPDSGSMNSERILSGACVPTVNAPSVGLLRTYYYRQGGPADTNTPCSDSSACAKANEFCSYRSEPATCQYYDVTA